MKLARLTGRTRIVACEGAFHGRTMGALTLTGQPAKRDAVRAAAARRHARPVRRRRRAARGSGRRHRRGVPRAGARRGRRAPGAGRLPAGGPGDHERGRRAARRSTRCRPASAALGSWFALPPGRHHARTSSRSPRASAAACRSARASASARPPNCCGPATTARPSAATRSCCAAGLAVLGTVAAEGLCEQAAALGKEIVAGVEALDHPLVTEVRGVGLLLGIGLAEPVAAAPPGPPPRPATWSTTCSRTRSGSRRR